MIVRPTATRTRRYLEWNAAKSNSTLQLEINDKALVSIPVNKNKLICREKYFLHCAKCKSPSSLRRLSGSVSILSSRTEPQHFGPSRPYYRESSFKWMVTPLESRRKNKRGRNECFQFPGEREIHQLKGRRERAKTELYPPTSTFVPVQGCYAARRFYSIRRSLHLILHFLLPVMFPRSSFKWLFGPTLSLSNCSIMACWSKVAGWIVVAIMAVYGRPLISPFFCYNIHCFRIGSTSIAFVSLFRPINV